MITSIRDLNWSKYYPDSTLAMKLKYRWRLGGTAALYVQYGLDGTVIVSPKCRQVFLGGQGGGRIVVRMFDLGSKGFGFDPRSVPKSECMFVNIYHY